MFTYEKEQNMSDYETSCGWKYRCIYCGCQIRKSAFIQGKFCSNECRFAYENEYEDIDKEVLRPTYYKGESTEVWDFVADQNLNFDLGNVIKYICRAGKKSKRERLNDLDKALTYLKHARDRVEQGENHEYDQ